MTLVWDIPKENTGQTIWDRGNIRKKGKRLTKTYNICFKYILNTGESHSQNK